MKNNKISVGFRMSENLVKKIDEYAENMGINRTAAISCILSMYFEGKDNIESLNNIATLINNNKGADVNG